jgi:glutaredoxin
MQCDVHGIAGGPDGRCALCHTVDKANARREGRRLGWILFLGLGTASASLLAIHELLPLPGGKAPLARAEPAPAPARLAAETPGPLADTAPPAAPTPPTPVAENAPPDSSAHEAPSLETPEAAASAPTTLIPAPPATAGPGKLSDAVLRAALVATPISMYTAPWCGTCRRAHEFFQSNGLPVTDRNVDDDPSALRELKTRSGGTAIPVIDVDGKLLRAGFDARAVAGALSESVQRRLRVQGVRVTPRSL